MSSVGVLTEKKSKCFVRRKKKSKCPKKNFQSVKRGGGMFKYIISGVRKKELKEKFWGRKEKKYWVEILLSSYSLVGLCINLQVLSYRKKKFQSILWLSV